MFWKRGKIKMFSIQLNSLLFMCWVNSCKANYRHSTTVTNQNLTWEEIKRRLNSGNGWYHSVQNHLSSRLLSKNIKIRIYKTIILSMVLYGCEILCLLHYGKNVNWGCLRTGCWEKYLDRKEIKWWEIGGNFIMRSFITCTPHQT
jgi:hypothetical protein